MQEATTVRRSVVLVRPGFEADARAELPPDQPAEAVEGAGLIAVQGDLPATALVFERQRLPDAHLLSEAELKPISEQTLGDLTATLRSVRRPWCCHAYATDSALQDRAAGFARALHRLLQRGLPDLAGLLRGGEPEADDLVLQLCRLPQGLWYSTAPSRMLSSGWLGGIPRLRDDPRAPSRSFLKLEEAFARMDEWPADGQSAVDLGAAPGGWTLALARRGCRVTAVDNGPLRLPAPEPGWGRVEYRRENGITFQPRHPVDWLVADMLVAPGVALGLLRRWMGQRLMRRLVVNIKIPQQQAYAAIAPVLAYLRAEAAHYRCEVRQLYHDRREVTVMGRAVR